MHVKRETSETRRVKETPAATVPVSVRHTPISTSTSIISSVDHDKVTKSIEAPFYIDLSGISTSTPGVSVNNIGEFINQNTTITSFPSKDSSKPSTSEPFPESASTESVPLPKDVHTFFSNHAIFSKGDRRSESAQIHASGNHKLKQILELMEEKVESRLQYQRSKMVRMWRFDAMNYWWMPYSNGTIEDKLMKYHVQMMKTYETDIKGDLVTIFTPTSHPITRTHEYLMKGHLLVGNFSKAVTCVEDELVDISRINDDNKRKRKRKLSQEESAELEYVDQMQKNESNDIPRGIKDVHTSNALPIALVDMVNNLLEASTFSVQSSKDAISTFKKVERYIYLLKNEGFVNERRLEKFFTPRTLDNLILASCTSPCDTIEGLKWIEHMELEHSVQPTFKTASIAIAACLRSLGTPNCVFVKENKYKDTEALWGAIHSYVTDKNFCSAIPNELVVDIVDMACREKKVTMVKELYTLLKLRHVTIDKGLTLNILTMAGVMGDAKLTDMIYHPIMERSKLKNTQVEPYIQTAAAFAYASSGNMFRVFQLTESLSNSFGNHRQYLSISSVLSMCEWDKETTSEALSQLVHYAEERETTPAKIAVQTLLLGIGKRFSATKNKERAKSVIAHVLTSIAFSHRARSIVEMDDIASLLKNGLEESPRDHVSMFSLVLDLWPQDQLWTWIKLVELSVNHCRMGDNSSLKEVVDFFIPMMHGKCFTVQQIYALPPDVSRVLFDSLELCYGRLPDAKVNSLFALFGMVDP
eukprot:CFRG0861T1